jgi:hypothetical protein
MARRVAHRRALADMLREEHQTEGIPTGSLSDIFEREPVDLTTFITGKDFLHNPALSNIQYDFVRTLEQVLKIETYIAMVEEFGEHWAPRPMKNMLVAEWGKGAGKDSTCRIGVTRVAYLLMCLKSPQTYFGLPEQDDIHILNVAASSEQARRAFFSPMKRLFSTRPCLSEFFRGDDAPGEMATSIRLKKGVELISGNSMADTQEGLNLIVGIADEIAAFKTRDELARAGMVLEGRESKSAEGIVRMLRTSANSRFPGTFKVAQISYPRYRGDAIEQAMLTGNNDVARYGDESAYYVSGPFATWEVNPRIASKKAFAADYNEDPEMAAAMYECQPPKAVNRFMRNDVAIAQAFSRSIPDPITVEYYWGLPEHVQATPHGPDELPGWQVRFHFHPDLEPMNGAIYAMHGDLALVGDRAGVAMSHVRTYTEIRPNPEAETVEVRPVIRNDFVFSFEADIGARTPDGVHAPREVQIRWYRQLVWALIAKGFYIASVTLDGFQSADMIQIFKSRGIESKVLSLDRNDMVYQALRDCIYDGRLEGYYRLRVKNEIESLRRLPNRRIDHPPGNGSKDEADALAGSVYGAIAVGGDEGDEPISANLATFAFDNAHVGGVLAPPTTFGGDAGASFGNLGEINTLSFGG